MGDEWSSKRLKRWGLAGTFVALGGVLVWSGTDLLIGRTISRFSPRIEKKLSDSLGHPLEIGDYRGLRPWGVALGRTRLFPGKNDPSSWPQTRNPEHRSCRGGRNLLRSTLNYVLSAEYYVDYFFSEELFSRRGHAKNRVGWGEMEEHFASRSWQ